MAHAPSPSPSALRRFLDGQSSSGLLLMAATVIALLLANSPLGLTYQNFLQSYLGPLSVSHWINDGLMAVFFLLVGLEIKREVIDGQLSTWSRRALPGIAAFGGMAVPAILYLCLNQGETSRGWAIPAATDIAFALAVISLLGKRVPSSLRVFLAALAIIDDLGAIIIIALFYTASLSLVDLGIAAALLVLLFGINRMGVTKLTPYLFLGAVLWVFLLRSGVHATLAGVLLAFAIPLQRTIGTPDNSADSPLHRLEKILHVPVGFLIIPIFGFANAGVRLIGLSTDDIFNPVTLGVGLGLLAGKVIGVFGFSIVAIRLGLADMPMYASRMQMAGTAFLCGIGFTMSIFITLLAFPQAPDTQTFAKIGILAGSLLAGLVGYILLRTGRSDWPPTPSR
jgi:NhaA family Na+:H+ antiporter